MRFVHLNIRDILKWDEFAEAHAIDAFCHIGSSFAHDVIEVWECFHEFV